MKTLADRAQAWLAGDRWAHELHLSKGEQKTIAPGVAKLRSQLRAARRFSLDDGFVREAVEMASVSPMLALARADLANLPYPQVWLEWDQEVRVKHQERMGTSQPLDPGDHGIAGALLVRNDPNHADVWTSHGFVSGRTEEELDAFAYLCNHTLDITSPEIARWLMTAFNEDVAILRDGFVAGWGYRLEGADDEDRKAAAAKYLARGCTMPETTFLLPLIEQHIESEEKYKRADRMFRGFFKHAHESRGDLRFYITVLAMINHVPYVEVHRPASGRFTRRLNTMDYLDTHVLTIKAGRTKTKVILDRAVKVHREASRKRAHEVRGHWAIAEYGHGYPPGCRHLPAPGTSDGKHCICSKCGSLLVWKDHHQRGDASLGFVKKDYEVTT